MRDAFDTYRQGVLWSPSYFAASCGGSPGNILKSYIGQRKTPR
jgi:putative transposase